MKNNHTKLTSTHQNHHFQWLVIQSLSFLSHAGCQIEESPFLTQLAARENEVRSGKMTTIIFIRIKEEKKNEISGYIDLNHRLKTEDFKLIFETLIN